MAMVFLATASLAFAADLSGDSLPVGQNGETTTSVSTPSYVTTTNIGPSFEQSGVLAPAPLPTQSLGTTVGATTAPIGATVNGRPFEILKRLSLVKERYRQANPPKPVKPKKAKKAKKKVKKGKYGLPSNARKYSVKKLDAIVTKVAREQGCTKAQIRKLKYIFHRESKNNRAIGGYKHHFVGMWQLKHTMAKGKPWWDPEWETRRAIRYMRGHRYAGFGKGIDAAYAHKVRCGWY